MHLHYLQEVLTLYFAKVTKLLKLQPNKISRLKCSRDHCWMIKYNLSNSNNYDTWKLFVWWLNIQYTIYCICCAFVGLANKLYKTHGTYIKIGIVLFGKFFTTKTVLMMTITIMIVVVTTVVNVMVVTTAITVFSSMWIGWIYMV